MTPFLERNYLSEFFFFFSSVVDLLFVALLWGKGSFCSPGLPGTYFVPQAYLKLSRKLKSQA